jgi:hypothetical protein
MYDAFLQMLQCIKHSYAKRLCNGSQSHDTPERIMRPAAILVNYVGSIKLHNDSGGLIYYLLLFLHIWPVNQPTNTGVACCHKKVGCPWCR